MDYALSCSALPSTTNTRIASHGAGWALSLVWLGLSGCLTVVSSVLAAFAWWRENPDFWRNAGGYPLWQRDLVKLTFYPLLLGAGFGSLFLLKSLFSGWPGSARAWGLHLTLILLSVLLQLAAMGMAWANNFENLLASRPLHSHEPQK